jgi:hypothetical protein
VGQGTRFRATFQSRPVHGELWAFWLDKETIFTKVQSTMYNHIYDPKADKKWRERGWNDEVSGEEEDREARCKAGKTIPMTCRIWVMKHRHGMTGTGKFTKRWKFRSAARCPRCGHMEETLRHVDKCEQIAAVK